MLSALLADSPLIPGLLLAITALPDLLPLLRDLHPASNVRQVPTNLIPALSFA